MPVGAALLRQGERDEAPRLAIPHPARGEDAPVAGFQHRRGIGREHALLFAAEGAKVVVNDLGGANDGTGTDLTPAQQVVEEIKAMGGEAVVNGDNVADWQGAQRMVNQAIETLGDLDINVGALVRGDLVRLVGDNVGVSRCLGSCLGLGFGGVSGNLCLSGSGIGSNRPNAGPMIAAVAHI